MIVDNYIRGKCHGPNADYYDYGVVTKFASVPKHGDQVTVGYKGNDGKTVLRVHMITHDHVDDMPFIVVHLTTT